MKKTLGILTAVVILSACSSKSGTDITGSWVQPIPGQESNMQGFTLEKGGKASSINMYTLKYESWERKGNKLILTGLSIGNRQTIPFSDTLSIEKLTQDSLILDGGDYKTSYSRKPAPQKADK